MAMINTAIPVPKFKFNEPRRNLPGRKGIATAEDRFTIAFMHAYLAQAEATHGEANSFQIAFAREIPVNGYGITDLLVVTWRVLPDESFPSGEAFAKVARPVCRAFEMKLFNWQKALSQASRYRYFAHQPIVVLPPDACVNALRVMDTFRRVKVGLWSFDPKINRIVTHFTPRPHRPRSPKYWFQSLEKAARTSMSVLPIREIVESHRA